MIQENGWHIWLHRPVYQVVELLDEWRNLQMRTTVFMSARHANTPRDDQNNFKRSTPFSCLPPGAHSVEGRKWHVSVLPESIYQPP